jgi:phenylalanyl-tRNA synthetase beta chain
MKVVYNWLKEFVDVTATAPELRERLSLVGVAIDSILESSAGPVLDAEVTANRPDCLGHYGMAREVAAIYRLPLRSVEPKLTEAPEKAADSTRVEIAATDLCGRYTARVLRGVKVQSSPEWLRRRLEAIGEKSINNVVDVTNYVMFDLGQPLHAFDLDKLADGRIIVRRARPEETIRTLDGAERRLGQQMCVIADAAHPVGIAGVMGGAESEITLGSRNILLESAWFNPISIRQTSKALGLRSEASYRFERGADLGMTEMASRRAAQLIAQVAGGEVLSGVVDVYPRPEVPRKIDFSRRELLRVMGADIADDDIARILAALGFQPSRLDRNGSAHLHSPSAIWQCTQPSWRCDVTREIDLVEEVARHYGYDQFPARLPPSKQPAQRLRHAAAEDRLRERIIALGYQEIVEIPLVDARRDELFRPAGLVPAVIGNPLAEDASVMRSSGVVSMLSALEWNLNHHQRNLRLFEIGRTYTLCAGEPIETPVLTIGATGLARQKTIYEQDRNFGSADLKGDLDRIGELAGGFAWKAGGPGWLAGARAARLWLGESHGEPLGWGGQLARRIADQLKLRQDVFVAELQLEPLLQGIEAARAAVKFKPIPRFPAIERDFSLVLADRITFAQVAETIQALDIPELLQIEAADLFRGGQIPAGKFSLMIRITFQSAQATLTDPQIAEFSSRIVAALERKLGASLRVS